MKRTLLTVSLAAATLTMATLPVQAQYKVIGADGSVTYTDRPPTNSNVKITTIGPRGGEAGGNTDVSLPFELRQVTARFPVTLYTSPDCVPCDSGRQFLLQRGVPYAEKRVTSEDDAAALERAVGGRTVPALMIGTQALRGMSQTDWTVYLDAAGYPRESKLPRSWQPPTATAIVERAAPPTASATTTATTRGGSAGQRQDAAAAAPQSAPQSAPPSTAPGDAPAIRF